MHSISSSCTFIFPFARRALPENGALVVLLAAGLVLGACGSDPGPGPVDGGGDGGDGAVATDFGPIDTDARALCTGDVDCNDGLFCNGREMCAPASASADVRGCVAGDAPCSVGESCDEMTNDCRTSCDDLDGDGHTADACGGDDCDDADASRFPGATEVCDANDEDCNDATLGFVDGDMDGAGSAACCNGVECGVDCDDSNASIRPGIADGPSMNCNGVDDDCDGVADVACPCADGERRACYGGPAGTREQGICIDGVSICAGGTLGSECIDDVLPASEVCNSLDDDCDGMIDEGVVPRYYRDVDGDGFGQTAMFVDDRCNPPAGYVAAAGDCDDTLPTVHPGLPDLCNGADDDCDGMTDEGAPQGTYYRDDDDDGYGATGTAVMACSAPMGFVPASGDCDDTSAGTSPVGAEVCDSAAPPADEDCDSMRNEGCVCVDGTTQPCGGGTPVRGVCRAGVQRCIAGLWAGCDGNVDPGTLSETCNGFDDDCDGMIDETLLAASCQADADSDGYGSGPVLVTLCRDAARMTYGYCPSGYSSVGGDCNDANSSTRPMGTEVCDAGNVDDDCDGSNNEGCTCANGAVQSCGGGGRAGVGICRSGTQRCVAGAWLPCEGNVEPAASETCNGLDDNCIGGIDEGVTVTVYVDSDGDTYGVGTGIVRCAATAGYALSAGDCNDSNPAVRPSSVEICNGLDDNCAGGIDEGLTVPLCYVDGDSDAYGAGSTSTQCRDAARSGYGFCPVGYTTAAGDCNNAIASINPGGTESCNGLDDDCDAVVDDGVLNTYYRDADSDGYGLASSTRTACTAPVGFAPASGDCNDGAVTIHPGAPEICDGVDQNCVSGVGDEPVRTFYRDADSDLYGTAGTTTTACSPPVGYVEYSGDCDDANAARRPGATEICNAVDDDCDAAVDDPPATAQCSGANPLAVNVTAWSCVAGICDALTCSANRGDCDGSPINGCESDLTADGSNCGACGNSCGPSALCTASVCDTLVDLSAGTGTACATWSSGRVICWGAGGAGETNHPALADVSTPRLLTDVGGVNVVAISHGDFGNAHVCAMNTAPDSPTYCWGRNDTGQVGDGTLLTRSSPQVIDATSGAGTINSVATGRQHTCAIWTRSLYCWGRNSYGELGAPLAADPVIPFTRTLPPTGIMPGSGTVDDVCTGSYFTCFVQSTGSVRCVGNGSFGKLGNGTYTSTSSTAIQTTTLGVDVACSADHACVVRSAAPYAQCWGANAYGQLGNSTTLGSNVPVTVSGAHQFTQIDAANSHTCARRADGTAWCWGNNGLGQLGDGTNTSRSAPVRVTGLTAVDEVAVGNSFSCARSGRDVYCWGYNASGQLGRGTMDALTTHTTPVLVTGF